MSITLSTLKSNKIKKKKRRGRGDSSGRGTYSGRGIKGQSSRSGGKGKGGHAGKKFPAFIGQIPKQRGFKTFKQSPVTVNLGDISQAFNEGELVTPKALVAKGLIKQTSGGVKVLGKGKLTKKLEIKANAFSKSAKDAITKMGGKAEQVDLSKKDTSKKAEQKNK